MAIADLVIEKRTVTFRDQSFEVRGLSLTDITELFKANKDEVKALFTEGADLDFAALITESPKFVARMICAGADEPSMVETVMQLPAGVQLEALQGTWELTAVSASDLGNLIAKMVQGVSTVSGALGQVKSQASSNGNDSPGDYSNESPRERALRFAREGSAPKGSPPTQ